MRTDDARTVPAVRRASVSVTYLAIDEITRGVGASQVVPYVVGLARRGAQVTVHSFEPETPGLDVRQRLEEAGVDWHAHHVRGRGSLAGAGRVLQCAALVQCAAWVRGSIVHARSDLPAASALAARSRAWVWDVRSFWADQRIAMGMLRRGSAQERVLRTIESRAAAESSAITTLSAAAIDVLAARHGEALRAKATVIPTCVDLEKFSAAAMPDGGRVQLLLSGTFNALYDLDLTLRFFEALRRLRPADLTLLRPDTSPWDRPVVDAGGSLATSAFAQMPDQVRASHAGLCLCRTDNMAAISGAAPTKLAEFLATGRPVVVNSALGDMDEVVTRHRCGIILRDGSAGAIEQAAHDLSALIDDDLTPMRCRQAAAAHFDLEQGVSRLLGVYQGLA